MLGGGERPPVVTPRLLRDDVTYTVTDLATGESGASTGADLLDSGVTIGGRPSIRSWLVHIAPVPAP